MCSDAPNTAGMNEAAVMSAANSKDALDWFKQAYAEGAGDRASASKAARDQSAIQLSLSKDSLAASREQRDRYNNTFAPIENQIAADAAGYNTPERREAAAGQAMADVDSAATLGRDATMRELAARGVDPGSGNSLMALSRGATQTAAQRAAAGNSARDRIETIGNARLMDAAGLGRGVVGSQTTQAQIGLNAGNSGVVTANTPNQISLQGAQMMGQGYQVANQGLATSGSLYGQAAGIQSGVDNANSQTAAGAGAAAGSLALAAVTL